MHTFRFEPDKNADKVISQYIYGRQFEIIRQLKSSFNSAESAMNRRRSNEAAILGSAGAEFPDFRPPAFLIDDSLLLDAGTIGSVLTEDEQWSIRNIFITHAHLDHIRVSRRWLTNNRQKSAPSG